MVEQESFTIFDTNWECCGLVARGSRVVAIYLPMERRALRRRIQTEWPGAAEVVDVLPALRRQIVDYFSEKEVRFTADLDLSRVPPFHRKVLEACREIPYGTTVSYKDLAKKAGNPKAARAVGGAMARNPFPLLIPCHRVLSSDGSIGGFSSSRGVQQKKRMLRLEGVL